MANYKKLIDVEVMEEVSESTMALVEDNGTLKKVPCGKGFGGMDVVTIKYDGTNPNSNPIADMSFEEAWQNLNNGNLLNIFVVDTGNSYYAPCICVANYIENNIQVIGLMWKMPMGYELKLFWIASGIYNQDDFAGIIS